MAYNSNRLIAKNMILLNARMIFSLLVSLYTSRIILNTLGIEDYGIYNVVAGLVTLFAFMSETTSTAIMRYLSFSIGHDCKEDYILYYRASLRLFAVFCIFSVLVAETVGLWFLMENMLISQERFDAALWVYQCCIVSIVFYSFQIPNSAVIVSNERMDIIAGIGAFDVVLKLFIALMLPLFSLDLLKVYGGLLLLESIVVYFLYRHYAIRTAPFIITCLPIEKKHFRDILGFTVWNMFGSLSNLARGHGMNILLNVFYGPILNAARGIAYQVYNAINGINITFFTVVHPQIVKLYSAKEKDKCIKLVYRSSKFSFSLLLIVSFPILVLTSEVLDFWLGIFPPMAPLFTKLVIVCLLIESISDPLLLFAQASGKLKYYQLCVGGFLIFSLPTAWIVYKMGACAESCFYIIMAFNFLALFLRLLILRYTADFPVKRFFFDVLLKIAVITGSSIVLYELLIQIEPLFFRAVMTMVISFVIIPLLVAFFVFSNQERDAIKAIVRQRLQG